MAVGVGALGQMAASTVQRGAIIGNAAISAGREAGEWQLALCLFAGKAKA